MKSSYIYFYTSLQNHRYFDAHVPFPKIEGALWRLWKFTNEGCEWIPPLERDAANLGAVLFERAKQEVTADLLAFYNLQRTVLH